MSIMAPISAGELVDKITILRNKADRIGDPAKEANVRKELAMLEALADEALPKTPEIDRLTAQLSEVNIALWDIEDGKRDCERRGDFGDRFVQLARSVYVENDRRAAIKRAAPSVASRQLPQGGSARSYAPLKLAWRFSRNAVTPSMKSSVLPATFWPMRSW